MNPRFPRFAEASEGKLAIVLNSGCGAVAMAVEDTVPTALGDAALGGIFLDGLRSSVRRGDTLPDKGGLNTLTREPF